MGLELLPLANIEDIAPFFIGVLIFVTPIVALLTRHQQRMAQILHERNSAGQPDARVLEELAALRQLVAQQALTLDDLSRRQEMLGQRLQQGGELRDRLNT